MSLFKEAARPCRTTRHYAKAFRHVRFFSQSRPVAALTKEEVQGAHQYCVALLSYSTHHSIASLPLVANLLSSENMIDPPIH